MSPADTAFILICAALVMFMTPGLALFYAGLVRAKNVLGTIMHSFFMLALATVFWVVIGYSLSFGTDIGGVIGGLDYLFLNGVGAEANGPVGNLPHAAFMIFQCMFAVITPALISGAYAERIKFSAFVLFSTLWLLFVYSPMCHWVWGGGWMGAMGALDFAGGAVVHMSSGAAALAAAMVLGARKGYGSQSFIPHNLPMTLTGMAILWVGWFGFNSGSALAADGLAATAFVTTHLAAATACIGWLVVEKLHAGHATTLGAASGALAGLVAITPAAGVRHPNGLPDHWICGRRCLLRRRVAQGLVEIRRLIGRCRHSRSRWNMGRFGDWSFRQHGRQSRRRERPVLRQPGPAVDSIRLRGRHMGLLLRRKLRSFQTGEHRGRLARTGG